MKGTKKSEDFVRSLDRSIFGSFAVPEEILILTDYIYRRGGDVANRYSVALSEALYKHGYDTNIDGAAELFFWYDINVIDANEGARVNEEIETRRALLDRIAAAPSECLPYYEVGVWEYATITKLITEGIDPTLAASAVA